MSRSAFLNLIIRQAFYWNCVRQWYCNLPNQTDPGCQPGQVINSTIILQECDAAPDCHCTAPASLMTGLPTFWTLINVSSLTLTWCAHGPVGATHSPGSFCPSCRRT